MRTDLTNDLLDGIHGAPQRAPRRFGDGHHGRVASGAFFRSCPLRHIASRRSPARRTPSLALLLLDLSTEDQMRYVVAWLLGVPLSVIALWYVVGHTACR